MQEIISSWIDVQVKKAVALFYEATAFLFESKIIIER